MDLLPLGDLRSELTLLGRWLLQELSGEREVTRLIEKESEQFPELVTRVREDVVQAGYEQAAEYARRRLTGPDGLDAEAVAAIAVGAVINYRRMEWTFGHPPPPRKRRRRTLHRHDDGTQVTYAVDPPPSGDGEWALARTRSSRKHSTLSPDRSLPSIVR